MVGSLLSLTQADLHKYSSSYILSLCFQLEVFRKKKFSGKILFLQKTLNHQTKTIWWHLRFDKDLSNHSFSWTSQQAAGRSMPPYPKALEQPCHTSSPLDRGHRVSSLSIHLALFCPTPRAACTVLCLTSDAPLSWLIKHKESKEQGGETQGKRGMKKYRQKPEKQKLLYRCNSLLGNYQDRNKKKSTGETGTGRVALSYRALGSVFCGHFKKKHLTSALQRVRMLWAVQLHSQLLTLVLMVSHACFTLTLAIFWPNHSPLESLRSQHLWSSLTAYIPLPQAHKQKSASRPFGIHESRAVTPKKCPRRWWGAGTAQ